MKAWVVAEPKPIDDHPLARVERDPPEPQPTEIRVRVTACGVCRTDLHLAVGELAPRRPGVVPGHEVVGIVDAAGSECVRFHLGDRVGIAWLRSTCGACRMCRRGRENLCESSRYTGWDADGGYAEAAVVDEAYAYALPTAFDDEHAAPLLCAGIIGYRALVRAELPAGGRLGIYGFGASAHLAAQVAMAQGATVHVMTRSAAAREHALELGVASVGPADARPPEPLDAAIMFAPAGELVRPALRALDPGRNARAGRHLPFADTGLGLRPRSVPGATASKASPPTREPTAMTSCAWRQACGSRCARRGTRSTGPTPRYAISPTIGSPAPRCWCPERAVPAVTCRRTPEVSSLLTTGFNHVAVITSDTERLKTFYTEVFDAEVLRDGPEVDGKPEVRMTVIHVGPMAELNVFEIVGNTEAQRQTPMFGRGRLDHLALQADSIEAFDTIRERLMARGATSCS